MPHTFDDLQQATVILGRPGLAGTGVTAGEKAELFAAVAALQTQGLADHVGVVFTDLATGDAVVFDGTNWVNQPRASGRLQKMTDAGGDEVPDVYWIATRRGIAITPSSPGIVFVEPIYGGSGTKDEVAHSDHTHPVFTPLRFPYAGTGIPLSTGSRPLVDEPIGGFEIGVPMKVTLRGYVHAQGVDDLSRFHIVLGIDGQTSSSSTVGGPDPYIAEWGVNNQFCWEFGRVITPAEGSSLTRTVTMDVQRVSGSLDIVSAFLVVEREAAR